MTKRIFLISKIFSSVLFCFERTIRENRQVENICFLFKYREHLIQKIMCYNEQEERLETRRKIATFHLTEIENSLARIRRDRLALASPLTETEDKLDRFVNGLKVHDFIVDFIVERR